MELEDAIELAIDGHAVLFVGAGYSQGATNSLGQPFKSARELADYLALKTGLPKGTPLDDAAEEFVNLHGEGELVRELRTEFTATAFTSTHKRIADLPWRRIYTTNYDNVLEQAHSTPMRHLRSVTLSDEARLSRSSNFSETVCVHLNGFVNNLTRDTIGSELKLTDSSYLTASISDSPWAAMFRQDLGLARAVFFVGYSLADLDIRRLLFDSDQLKQKCFFIIGQQPEETILRRVLRFGVNVSMDSSRFAELLAEKSSNYLPEDFNQHIGYSIKQFTTPQIQSTSSDQSVFDLLLLGNLKTDLVWKSLHEGEQYFLERPQTEKVLDSLERGPRVAVIHSELGNGKSLVLEGIKCRALEKGYQVYTVSVRSGDIFSELDLILNSPSKTLVIIDNYPDWIDVINHYSLNAKDNSSLLLSARNAVNDTMIDTLSRILGRIDIPEYSADRLTSGELEWIVHFFNQYGLWAERAAWPVERKLTYLSTYCGAQFSAILIRLFQSPQIAARFDSILQKLNSKREYYEVLLSVMMLVVIQRLPTMDLLMDIWGTKVLETQFKRNEVVREFFDFQAGEIKLRSATAAQFILKHVADTNLTIDTLVTMAKAIDKAGKYSETHRQLMRALMQFSTLQTLLPERQKRPATIRYYEGIKNLVACRRNPQFWLQYAIACLTLEELDRAEKYFATAYSLASSRNFPTYQIDNHFARFLLLRAVETGDTDKCMGSFREARRTVEDQIKDDRMHYPYRVARFYRNFFEAFESKLNRTRLEEIIQAAVFVLHRIEALPEDTRRRIDISECFDDMTRIIAKREDLDVKSEVDESMASD